MNKSKNHQNGLSTTDHEIITEKNPISWKLWKKKRYIVAFMVFFGMICNYSIRSLLSVAIIAMTEMKTIHYDNGTIITEQEFAWNSKEKGVALSAIFYGYLCTMSIGGFLACKFGGCLVFSYGIFGAAFLTLITPFFATYGIFAVVPLRAIVGLFEGAAFISSYAVLGQWCPPNERTIMMSILMSGVQIGNICGMFLSGILAANFGWKSCFYVFGGYGCVLFIIWRIFIGEKPSTDKFISEDERRYILESLKINSSEKPPIPWKSILRSCPFYAYTAATIAEMWGFLTSLTTLPMFMNDALRVDLQNSGILSAAPYISSVITLPILARLADFILSKGYLTNTQLRRYYTILSFLSQAVLLCLVGHIESPIWIVICMVVIFIFNAFAFTGYLVSPLEMAPQFASVISGLAQTVGAFSGIISPILTGYVVQNRDVHEWQIIFYVTAALYFVGGIIYFLFGKSELQPWAKQPNN